MLLRSIARASWLLVWVLIFWHLIWNIWRLDKTLWRGALMAQHVTLELFLRCLKHMSIFRMAEPRFNNPYFWPPPPSMPGQVSGNTPTSLHFQPWIAGLFPRVNVLLAVWRLGKTHSQPLESAVVCLIHKRARAAVTCCVWPARTAFTRGGCLLLSMTR